jgi:hypothetical protein
VKAALKKAKAKATANGVRKRKAGSSRLVGSGFSRT